MPKGLAPGYDFAARVAWLVGLGTIVGCSREVVVQFLGIQYPDVKDKLTEPNFLRHYASPMSFRGSRKVFSFTPELLAIQITVSCDNCLLRSPFLHIGRRHAIAAFLCSTNQCKRIQKLQLKKAFSRPFDLVCVLIENIHPKFVTYGI
jgi:hypothetical protein